MTIYSDDFIRIRGAKEHNLKNIDVDIPRNKLVVITGPSPVRGSRRSRSTRFMPKASGAMWRAFPPTRASS